MIALEEFNCKAEDFFVQSLQLLQDDNEEHHACGMVMLCEHTQFGKISTRRWRVRQEEWLLERKQSPTTQEQ